MSRPLDVDAVVESAVRRLRHYHEYIDLDELRQEAYQWIVSNPGRVERYYEMESPASAAHYLRLDIMRPMAQLAKREKAYCAGYEMRDQYEYSAKAIRLRGLIAQCLSAIVTGTREQEVRGLENEGTSNADPAETSMNFVVAMADIEKGWSALHSEHQKLLAEYFVYGKTSAELAVEYDCTDKMVFDSLKRALRRLTGPLNGDKW